MLDASDAQAIVLKFGEAWRRADMEAVYGLMTDDILYHNIPREPISGLPNVKRYAESYVSRFGDLLSVEWEIKNTAVNGNVVFIERISRLAWANGRRVECPIVGVFKVRDGKVASWRDYFDRATFDA